MKYIRFPQAETRCDPFNRLCSLSGTCARHLAAGKPRADLSTNFIVYAGIAPFCNQFLSVEKAAQLADTKPVKQWPSVAG